MREHLLIFWQRKLEDAYHENHRLQEENKRLQAEVERLTKAGDLMWNALLCSGCSECMGMYNCHEDGMKAWEDAKKGGQS
ncbi:MAG: hypothetical protein RLZ85_577 [Verrucomicrobiota bacterium]|jgi:hypothetical protein